MKAKIIYSAIVIVVFGLGKVNSQIVPSIQKSVLSQQEKDSVNLRLNEYTVFTMDKRKVIDSLYKNGRGQIQISIDDSLDWILNLQFNDMRAANFKQTYTTDSGTFEVEEPFIVNTFKGWTSEGQVVRFTIDENNFFGVILNTQFHYVIKSAKDYTKNRSDERLIVYKSSDIIFENDDFDYIGDALMDIDEGDTLYNFTKGSNNCTYYFRIATDADYQFYQKMDYNLMNTYHYILSALNIVEGVYESAFGMKFIIPFQHVYTTFDNTPYNSTNAADLFADFQYHWKNNRKDIERNIAHLFTGKLIDSVAGYTADRGHIDGGNLAYSLSKYKADMYKTVAHEIGHNFNAKDNPRNCDCNTSAASVMCQGQKREDLWFCQKSIDQISSFIQKKKNKDKLIGGFPNTLNLSGSSTDFRLHQATQTITSTQTIEDGYTIYKAGTEVELNAGFEVEAGAEFEIIIGTDCE